MPRMNESIRLTPEVVREIEKILSNGKTVEMAVRSGKVILWSVNSKKKIEMPIV